MIAQGSQQLPGVSDKWATSDRYNDTSRYLSLAERMTIAGAGVDIAEELGRAASTVFRELRRKPDAQGWYLPTTAQRMAIERQSRPSRTRRITLDEQLCGVLTEPLGKRWSPERVAHELLPVRFSGVDSRVPVNVVTGHIAQ